MGYSLHYFFKREAFTKLKYDRSHSMFTHWEAVNRGYKKPIDIAFKIHVLNNYMGKLQKHHV